MRVDAINERITTLKAEEAEHAAVIADLEIRKENALTILHNDLDAIAKDRSETVNGIDNALVDLYEKIRETTISTITCGFRKSQVPIRPALVSPAALDETVSTNRLYLV